MTPIPRTFFITGLGRSGTTFLAGVLNRSREYHVVHEWKIPRTPFRDGRLQHFPLWRFYLARHPFGGMRRGYGEVNSHLRRTVRPDAVGREALIEKRGVIVRDPRDVIASAMNRLDRTEADFTWLCDERLRDFAALVRLLDHPTLHYERFEFERLTRDAGYVRQIAEWAGITDLDVSADLVQRKVNTSGGNWFPRWDGWTPAQRDIFHAAAQRHGVAVAAERLASDS